MANIVIRALILYPLTFISFLGGIVLFTLLLLLRPIHRRWGASTEEANSPMPGDIESMRYRDTGADKSKILWIVRNEPSEPAAGTNIISVGSAMWLDQGKPWVYFNFEELIFNQDVSTYIRQRGQ